MEFGLLFPGQGAQKVGMGADFVEASPAARALYDRADAALGFSLSGICFEGPQEALNRTDVAQPAIYVTSLAALAALEERLGQPVSATMAAGLSLGEYTAMAASGAVSFLDGLQLVRLRGEAMQAASDAMPSSMTSVMGLEVSTLEQICMQAARESGGVCQVANLNSPGQVVVSGQLEALDLFDPLASAAGARRVIRLAVAGAFHSEVMRPAAERLGEALAGTPLDTPSCPVWQNATAARSVDPATLRENLARQLTAPVLWQASFASMAEAAGATPFLEPAPGRVLAGLARKIAPSASVLRLDSVAALEPLLNETT